VPCQLDSAARAAPAEPALTSDGVRATGCDPAVVMVDIDRFIEFVVGSIHEPTSSEEATGAAMSHARRTASSPQRSVCFRSDTMASV
jgi:hypothetical protein